MDSFIFCAGVFCLVAVLRCGTLAQTSALLCHSSMQGLDCMLADPSALMQVPSSSRMQTPGHRLRRATTRTLRMTAL